MTCRAIAVVVLVACGSSPATPPPRTFGGDRPVNLQVPSTVEDGKLYPLVVVLHGFGANGFVQEAYFGMSSLAADDTAFVLAPDGTTNSLGKQFWNADPNCCDLEHQNPDDVAYLGGLIDEVSAAWPIDPKAVVVIGHSNGGYMAYRLACDRADVIGDIVVLAGQAASTTCTPSRAVNVLHIHGSADSTVPFAVAAPSVQTWATYNHCGAKRDPGPALDLDATLAGSETHTEVATGCPAGVAVELWTVEGGGHIPSLTSAFEPTVWQWLTTHRRS